MFRQKKGDVAFSVWLVNRWEIWFGAAKVSGWKGLPQAIPTGFFQKQMPSFWSIKGSVKTTLLETTEQERAGR